jgi:hypothetical protein
MDESVDEPKDQFISGLISQLGTSFKAKSKLARELAGGPSSAGF